MSQHNDLLYLDHMADHADRALRIAARLGTYAAFQDDEFLQPALIREVEVIGEASTHVSPQFKEAHANWPWRQMRAMRNELIHGYANINLAMVWNTVRDDLPELMRLLSEALDDA